ncbi:beta-glucosidase family protein [Tsukamurella soli]|uniref:Glycoside hydrolase family 3 C-terminal domain-containing protein n=1 Tax=Tsukamurella soli TaxID=644556 RepID=A0ABP8JIU5_9ACTN
MTTTRTDLEQLIADRVAGLTLEQKVRLLTGADFWSLYPEPAAGLRRLVVSDGPAGVRGETWDERSPSANVPSPTALAATWDLERVSAIGRIIAGEARRKGVDVVLAPTINLHRTPYGGRYFENYSEDPTLTAAIGAAYISGVQSGGVGATAKHFVANDTETDRFTYDAIIDERTLREVYLVPFEAAVRQAGVWAVMAAYNSVDGATMTESPLLREVLQGEWGFDGVTMTDWYAGRSLAAASAGLDLLMPGPTGPWGDALVAAVRAGEVPEGAVDDKVARILRLAARVGALDVTESAVPPSYTDGQVAAELRAAAADGFVLARNEAAASADSAAPLLPLRAVTRVAVVGPNATPGRNLGGGSATVYPAHVVSPLDGIRAALGDGVDVRYARGGRTTERDTPAPVEWLSTPDGETGVRLEFVDGDGAVLHTETRRATSFTWLGDVAPGVPLAAVAAVRARTTLRVPVAGTYRLGISGVGAFRLAADGMVLLDETVSLPEGADPVEAVMSPPQVAVEVALDPARPVELALSHPVATGGGFGDAAVSMLGFSLTADAEADADVELAEAETLAGWADVTIAVVGTTEEVESEGTDRRTLALPGRQDELVRRIVAANPRTVVVVNSGAPVLLPWADDVPAVLLAWFPGQEFGAALGDVLTGVAEPGGRLASTWPLDEEGLPSTTPVDGRQCYEEGLHIGYRAYQRDGRTPRFPFGHGLGYTGFQLGCATIVPAGEGVRIDVPVRNTGDRRGKIVVQVFASRPDSALERPVRWLAGFATARVDAAAEATVTVDIPARAFQHWDAAAGEWATEPGMFALEAGTSIADLGPAVTVTR